MFSDKNKNKVLNLFRYTKGGFIDPRNFPNGEIFDSAYHTLEFGDIIIKGQRNNKIRVNEMKKHVNFKNKVMIDFGCNTGGILFQLRNDLKQGIGFDYDSRCINAATYLSNYYNNNLKFYTFNFDKEPLKLMDNFFDNVDIVSILSMGSWVKNWKKLYSYAASKSNIFIFEENNVIEGKPQLEHLKSLYKNMRFIGPSLDDISNKKRNLYLFWR